MRIAPLHQRRCELKASTSPRFKPLPLGSEGLPWKAVSALEALPDVSSMGRLSFQERDGIGYGVSPSLWRTS